ncbi:glycosyltransferase family 2 protein [Enterococcus casseliflavus]|uniref:glycosyltransferase family 2 protein n=1 Tax=Enterococcus casseliflavus TaxID=37734 RepID=UPI001BCF4347|nr:glycosyltransferase [Enterococcus casseliflavus]
MPVFSVIVPVYNSEKFIRKTLESITNQTFHNYEIIVVDDGCTDNSISIIEEYAKYFQKINIVRQKNSGVSAARNRGIKEASGDFICFLDSDDYWSHLFLEKMYNKISATNVDIVICGTQTFSEKDNTVKKENIKLSTDDCLLNYLKGEYWAATGTWAVKRKFLLKNNIYFSEEVVWAEDLEFIVKCLFKGKTQLIQEPLFTYVLHDNSLSDFSVLKFSEIHIWYKLKKYILAESSPSDTTIYVKRIENWRIPMVVIRILFESLKVGRLDYALDNSGFSKKFLFEEIDKFKLPIRENMLYRKVYLYKKILKCKLMKIFFKIISKIIWRVNNGN